jgi:transposase
LFGERITESGCPAHARRKFFDLWANHNSAVAEQALVFFGELYDIEREVKDLDVDERRRLRQSKAKPIADDLQAWLIAQRQKVPEGSALIKAIDYSLNRWPALTRYPGDGRLPAENNWIENRIHPIALGRANWLFAGSLRAGQRAAAIMSLMGSAKLNALDPHACLRDVLERLPTHPASRIADLLPHRWHPSTAH